MPYVRYIETLNAQARHRALLRGDASLMPALRRARRDRWLARAGHSLRRRGFEYEKRALFSGQGVTVTDGGKLVPIVVGRWEQMP
jgi:hypothetical protein